MTKTTLIRRAALSLPLALFAGSGHAQTIDYGSLEQLFNEPVTTSATGSPQRSTEAPVAMEIISAEDIKRSGATDIPTILSRVAGVDVLTWGAGGAADVSIRGYDQGYSPRLLVLINGRQVYLDHYGYTAWASLPVELSEIRQIEVVKGPNSALFGFNAVGGVVNIITYNPKYDQKSSATLSAGQWQYAQRQRRRELQARRPFAARVSAGVSRTDQWQQPDLDDPDRPDRLVNPRRRAVNVDTLSQLADAAPSCASRRRTRASAERTWSRSTSTSPPQYTTKSIKASLSSETGFGLDRS